MRRWRGPAFPNIFEVASLLQSWNADIRNYFAVHVAEGLRAAVTLHLDTDVPETMNREDRGIYDKKVGGYLFALQALISAIKAAPFLSEPRFQYLFEKVKDHPFPHLRPEADWAMARRGGDQALTFLKDRFQIWQSHSRAIRYLRALGEALPALTAQDPARFKAMVDYADWMADEQDFAGYPLENIKILNRFDLVWPEPGQTTPFWRVAYDTLDLFTDEPELGARTEGISLVSTAGFARFFEDFEDPEDKCYNLSAAVEYDEAYKPYVESWPDRDWCEQRLEALNPGVFERDDVFG